ncbi:MAG: NADH-quinone oxidoreductase subunit N [Fimbriiglobus sp.]
MIFSPESVAAWQQGIVTDLGRLLPECVLVGAIVVMLLLRMLTPSIHSGRLAVLFALTAAGIWLFPVIGYAPSPEPGSAFTGLLDLSEFSYKLRGMLLGFLVGLTLLTQLSGLPDQEDAADFFVLVFGLILGLMFMTTASHFLTIFLSVEMASLPGYALAGFLKGRRTAGEAAMKYVLYGAAASGVMLYGMSLITVTTATLTPTGFDDRMPTLALMGWVCVGVGLLFKLGLVPLHLWLPDVLDGSSAEVGAILSTASKIGAFGLVVRVLGGVPRPEEVQMVLLIIAMLTMTWGNLAAYRQTQLKRLFAYSSIAHAGTMALVLAIPNPQTAILTYLVAYLLMNLGAFATISLIRNATGDESEAALTGLFQRSPALAIGFALCVFSLLGLPPLAGFFGKFVVFQELYFASQTGSQNLRNLMLLALAVGVLNTVLSAGYYLRLLRIAFLDNPTTDAVIPSSLYTLMLGLGLLALGLFGNFL